MDERAITIKRIEAFALSVPVDGGPRSSLAPMPTRNGLLVRLSDGDGGWGWGEAWCNFPPRGNLAKLLLLEDVLGPLLIGAPYASWTEVRPALEGRLARMEIHTGEKGPFSHLLAAIDIAVADLTARRYGVSLSKLLTDAPADTVAVYASSPDADRLETVVPALLDSGHNAVKIKIGYNWETDRRTLNRFRALVSEDVALYVDANQAWAPEEAVARLEELPEWVPLFVEEPIRADYPVADWARLASASSIRLAAGENILSAECFAAMVQARALSVVQPDIAKWGGVSGALAVGADARAKGAECCLHYMGTALGLCASLHVMAAIGGDGRVELDANDNPLRTDLGEINLAVQGGRLAVPRGPGIGFVPDPKQLQAYTVGSCTLEAP